MPQNNSTDFYLILFKNHVGYSRLTFPVPNFPRKSIKLAWGIGVERNRPPRARFRIKIRQRQRHGQDIFSHENLRAFPSLRSGWWASEGSCPYYSCLHSALGATKFLTPRTAKCLRPVCLFAPRIEPGPPAHMSQHVKERLTP